MKGKRVPRMPLCQPRVKHRTKWSGMEERNHRFQPLSEAVVSTCLSKSLRTGSVAQETVRNRVWHKSEGPLPLKRGSVDNEILNTSGARRCV